MNLEYRFEKFVLPSGIVSGVPTILFQDELANNSMLDEFLKSLDMDYGENEFFDMLDNYWHLDENERGANTELWTMDVNKDNTVTIYGWEELHRRTSIEDCYINPSITLSIDEIKKLIIEYRKRAKEYRKEVREINKKNGFN